MKPQGAAFLEKAQALLREAETMLKVDLNDAAGRTAYLAGFHAAQALVFETHGRALKTHSGVRSEFARLVKTRALIVSFVVSLAMPTSSKRLPTTNPVPVQR